MLASVNTALLSLVFSSCLPRARGHNWLLTPETRQPGQLYGAGQGENNNCESDNTQVPPGNIFQRGQNFTPTWVWNNHWNGFARFSIVPLGDEVDKDKIHDPVNFIKISCHTQNCGCRAKGLDGPEYDYYAPYNLPAQQCPFDNSEPSLACKTDITFPTYLADGNYVLQWLYYGVHDSDGVTAETLPFYRSCANIAISGGSPLTQNRTSPCAFVFEGGDRALGQDANNPDISQCGYWKWNAVNASMGYYNPDGMRDSNNGGWVVDTTAMRHGPPAEVLACGGTVGPNVNPPVTSNPPVATPTTPGTPGTSPTLTLTVVPSSSGCARKSSTFLQYFRR